MSAIVNLVLAVLLSAWSGFFTMDFLLSGIYTWPRSSRVVTLTCAVIILVYEFIYKEHQARHATVTGIAPLKMVVYTCMIPLHARHAGPAGSHQCRLRRRACCHSRKLVPDILNRGSSVLTNPVS